MTESFVIWESGGEVKTKKTFDQLVVSVEVKLGGLTQATAEQLIERKIN